MARRIGAVRAALANVLGFGLGYVYLGRMRFAYIWLGLVILLMALSGRLRLVFNPITFYFASGILVCVGLLPIVHCAIIAVRNKEIEAKPYNRWWLYTMWIVVSWFVSGAIQDARPVLFGFEPFRVPSASMSPTLVRGDLLMCDTWRYARQDPEYGDLVVFVVPGSSDAKFVKRVVFYTG